MKNFDVLSSCKLINVLITLIETDIDIFIRV